MHVFQLIKGYNQDIGDKLWLKVILQELLIRVPIFFSFFFKLNQNQKPCGCLQEVSSNKSFSEMMLILACSIFFQLIEIGLCQTIIFKKLESMAISI